MGKHRSRSRSRSRDRKKESHRDREKDRERDRKNRDKDRQRSSRKSRSRSRSPRHRRDRRSKSPRSKRDRSSSPESSHKIDYLTLGNVKPKQQTTIQSDKPIILDPNELEGKSKDEIEMLKIMGFSGFDTTKGKHVDGACNAYAVNIQQKRKYRQYMNRKGGFNRPLDPVA
ncbi:unnamed protein product [Brachionus calyciflorus]|uniref:U4/U6.U5 small nuclear ribonucleoprotein 27 kDa protein n=1 Tax=Brachionus calyciflorus TaxID=104777 RepID=A0A813RK67_9BILA|nr:unnamed protein product [Brachionus calyciflorus]